MRTGHRHRHRHASSFSLFLLLLFFFLFLLLHLHHHHHRPAIAAALLLLQPAQDQSLRRLLQATLPASSPLRLHNLSAPFFSFSCSSDGVVRCSGDGAVSALFLEGLALAGLLPDDAFSAFSSSLTRLSFFNNSLRSPLPASLWRLHRLQHLSLASNLFHEELRPGAQLWKLRSLQTLDLSRNRFFGSVPAEITVLRDLRCLFLNSNRFAGALPSSFGKKLRSLTVLDLSSNRFSGSLAPLSSPASSPSQLQKVLLSNNAFTGPIPADMAELEELNLSRNRLTGSLSKLLSTVSMPRLRELDLSGNRISGSIPEKIGSFASLASLDLSGNLLEGPLPASMAELMGHLKYLDLSSNGLVGRVSPPIPASSRNAALRHLNLSYNEGIACDSALVEIFGAGSFAGVADCRRGLTQADPRSASKIEHEGEQQQQKKKKKKRRRKKKLGFVIGVAMAASSIVGLILLLFLVVCCRRRKRGGNKASSLPALRISAANRKEDSKLHSSGPFSFQSDSGPWAANVRNAGAVAVIMFEKPLLRLSFADLLRATSSFDRETQVSQGGLGPVYRALLPGGLHVSIKVLIEGRVLTNESAAAELESLARIKHPNLVPLLGYCIVGEERLVLYEFMRNGGLHRWLLGSPDRLQEDGGGGGGDGGYGNDGGGYGNDGGGYGNNAGGFGAHCYDVSRDLAARASLEPLPQRAQLPWPIRHKIALGVARALAFLHHGQSAEMVHRDVKASNVMLDGGMEPHLANTGLAGLLAGSSDAALAGGSPGYAPPEYGKPGRVSTMGDVFSYGVILLELVTGKKPAGDTYELAEAKDGAGDGAGAGDGDSASAMPRVFGHSSPPRDLVSWVRALMQGKRNADDDDDDDEDRGLYLALDRRACDDATSRDQMLQVLRIGYLCTAEAPSKRPTIQQVVGLLKDINPNLTSPPLR